MFGLECLERLVAAVPRVDVEDDEVAAVGERMPRRHRPVRVGV